MEKREETRRCHQCHTYGCSNFDHCNEAPKITLQQEALVNALKSALHQSRNGTIPSHTQNSEWEYLISRAEGTSQEPGYCSRCDCSHVDRQHYREGKES